MLSFIALCCVCVCTCGYTVCVHVLIELRCVFLCLNSMYSCRIGSVNRCNNITWFAMTQQKFSVQYVVPVFHSHIKPKFGFF